MKQNKSSNHLSQFIDPFIGANQPGNCLVGPYLPNSLVRLGPDSMLPLKSPRGPCNGYNTELPIQRFSHTHTSGTGGGARYGNIGVTPMLGEPRFQLSAYEKRDEQAEAGYYTVRLQPDNILVELTSTHSAGIHRYTFPEHKDGAILIDAGSTLQNYSGAIKEPGDGTGASLGGFIEITSDFEIMGRCDASGGWGGSYPYTLFFYARFDQPFSFSTVANADGPQDSRKPTVDKYISGRQCRAVVGFSKTQTIDLKIGISYVSFAKARENLEREAGDLSFDALRKRAAETWNTTLANAAIQGKDKPEKQTFFHTMHHRLKCMPGDLGSQNEFVYWNTPVRHFNDFYCYWDSVRNANSLLFLIDTETEVAKLNCVLDIADRKGWLIDAWIGGHSAFIQGGSSTDILFAEAAQKNIPGIDYEKAFRYMRKNREERSPNPHFYGRYHPYHEIGYLPVGTRHCCSRNLEYAYQDWCIGKLAEVLGEADYAQTCYQASATIWDHWRDDLKSFAPRTADGAWWQDYDPSRIHGIAPGQAPFFYEGCGHDWSFHIQQDIAGLVKRHGGPDAFIQHLDYFFEKIGWKTKEIILHVPYLYHYVGRPDLSTEKVKWTLNEFYEKRPLELTDNEDMGCVSAYYMCASMGIYPMMGQDIYLLTTPCFREIELKIGTDKHKLSITCDRDPDQAPYIETVYINNQEQPLSWIRHKDIAQGGEIRFKLCKHPTPWGQSSPPSIA